MSKTVKGRSAAAQKRHQERVKKFVPVEEYKPAKQVNVFAKIASASKKEK